MAILVSGSGSDGLLNGIEERNTIEAYLDKRKVEFVDICLLLAQHGFIGRNLDSYSDDKVSDTYAYF